MLNVTSKFDRLTVYDVDVLFSIVIGRQMKFNDQQSTNVSQRNINDTVNAAIINVQNTIERLSMDA
jgi:hypothetical protein